MYLPVKQICLWQLLICLYCFNTEIAAQIVFTQHFTDQLQAAHLDYYRPIEEWYHVTPKQRDRFLKYDVVLVRDDQEVEIRYLIEPYADRELDQFPHIEMTRLLSHIATNNDEISIRAVMIQHEQAKERFAADWGMCQYFVPKRSFSKMPFGTLVSLYAKGKSTVHAIILYRDIEFDPFDHFHQIRFRE